MDIEDLITLPSEQRHLSFLIVRTTIFSLFFIVLWLKLTQNEFDLITIESMFGQNVQF